VTNSLTIEPLEHSERADVNANKLSHLRDLTIALAQAVDLKQVADILLSQVSASLGAAGGAVVVSDEGHTEFRCVGVAGLRVDWNRILSRFSLDAPLPIADAIRDNSPVLLADAEACHRSYPGLWSATGESGGLVAVPMRLGDFVGGVMFTFPPMLAVGLELDWLSTMACMGAQAADRILAHQGRRDSEARFARLFDSNVLGIFFTGTGGVITQANRAFLDILGYGDADLRAGLVRWDQLIPPEDVELQAKARSEAQARGLCGPFETVLLRKDGERITALAAGATLAEAAFQGVGFVLDLTERKRLENDLRRRANELAEADRQKTSFLAVLGHELRGPLAPLRNAIEIIRQRGPDRRSATQQAVEMMDRQVRQLTRLIDDLLDVSRVTHGKLKLQPEPVDLQSIVKRAVEIVQPLIEARGHQLTVSVPCDLWFQGDAARLGQVMANLLHNAAKYTPADGLIAVTGEQQGHEAVIKVRDNGAGIPAQLLPRIFDPFTQALDNLEDSLGGLGVGLALVKNIVELHGGSVQASSAGPSHGSEFTVRLPLQKGGAPTPAQPAIDSYETAVGSRRLLIVDDNADAAESLAMLLRAWGHEVRIAYDGPAALAAATVFAPEIVILDIGLPGGMSGFEIGRQLRASRHSPKPMLMALTGFGHEENRRRALSAGFDVHMTKPADLAELRRLLERPLPK
jgi:PAS domain S-box-containing protein